MNEKANTKILDTGLAGKDEYARAFRFIFWGYLLFLIHISFNAQNMRVDLAPCIGLVLVAIGAWRLSGLHRRAYWASALAIMLLPLNVWLAQKITFTVHDGMDGMTYIITPLFPLSLAVIISAIAMTWILCGIVADAARHTGANQLAAAALFRRKAFAGFFALLALAVAGSFITPVIFAVCLIIAIPVGIVALFLLFALLWRAGSLFKITNVERA